MELEGIMTGGTPSPVSSRRTSSASTRLACRTYRDRRRERLNTEILVAVTKADLLSVMRLIDEGGSVNATCRESRQTALHVAAASGHNGIAEYLLSKRARARAADRIGRTPAHLAAWYGHLTILNLLGKRDPSLLSDPIVRPDSCADHSDDLDSWNHCHQSDREGECDFTEKSTPLHLACKRSNVSCVNFLLECGAPVDVQDALGLTPLDVTGVNAAPVATPQGDPADKRASEGSSHSNEEESDETSDVRETDLSPLSYDSIPFKIPIIKKLKSPTKKREVFPPSDPGLQKHAVTLIAKSLFDKGAIMPKTNIKEGSVRSKQRSQVTALHTAVQNENLELITFLLESNGCMLTWNEDGDTPLHVAIRESLLEPLKLMLNWKNAPSGIVDTRDSAGRTLLHLAVMYEWTDGVNQLLENGASVTASNNLRENVFHISAARGNYKIMEELLSVPDSIKEAVSVAQLQRYYIRDYESWVKWIVFVCSLIVGLLNPSAFWWSRHLTSITVLLAWVELLFLVARCPNWGFYVLMFSRVAIKVIQVLLTFTFLLLGFTFAFMLQFNGAEPFSTFWVSLVKVFVMMFEFDYEATFENVNADNFLSVASRILFLAFVVLVAIVLMNLMVGLAVSDIALLETQGRTQRLAKQIGFLSLLETLVCSRKINHILPDPIVIWLAKRRTVPPCIIFKAGGPTLECPHTQLPRPVQASILERVTNSSTSDSVGDLGTLLTRLERLEAIVPSKGQLKDLLRAQSNAIQQVQESVQYLLGLHKVNRSNMSINRGASNNNLNVQTDHFLLNNNYPMRF